MPDLPDHSAGSNPGLTVEAPIVDNGFLTISWSAPTDILAEAKTCGYPDGPIRFSVSPVPEPSSLALLLSGFLGGLAVWRRRSATSDA
jgi:hypothetical protein